VLIGLGPLGALAALLVPAAAVSGGLPDPIATHWGLDGSPDGSTSRAAFVLGITAVWALGWIALAAQLRARDGLRLTVAPFAWAVMWFAGAVGAVVVLANDGAANWWDAAEVGLPLALVPVAVGALAAAVAAWLERARVLAEGERGERFHRDVPSVGLRPHERAVWSAHVRSRVNGVAAVVVGAALGAGAILAGGPAGWVLASAALVAVAAIATLSELEATVDERGLTIALGPFGLPRRRVPLSQIAGAEQIDVDPWRWGGWGYRKVPRRPGATAIVMRAGEGLRLVLRDGRELVVTVPDAATAAGLLGDLRDRDDRLVRS
jgi:hypothetical protein